MLLRSVCRDRTSGPVTAPDELTVAIIHSIGQIELLRQDCGSERTGRSEVTLLQTQRATPPPATFKPSGDAFQSNTKTSIKLCSPVCLSSIHLILTLDLPSLLTWTICTSRWTGGAVSTALHPLDQSRLFTVSLDTGLPQQQTSKCLDGLPLSS